MTTEVNVGFGKIDLPTPTFILASVVVYYVFVWFYFSRNRGLSLPPGPKRNWITGNLYHLPKAKLWLRATEWKKTYGALVYIQVFSRRTLFLNSVKVASDLLDSRSSIYSERPISRMSNLAGRRLSIFRTSLSDQRFKTLRRLIQDGLNPRAVKSYRPIQLRENIVLLNSLVDSPKDFRAHIRRNAVAVIIKVAYGYQVGDNDDRVVRILEDSLRIAATPQKFWVEFMPFLRFIPSWFPGAGFKRYARSISKELSRFENVPFDLGKERILSGDYVESFMSKHLVEENGLSMDPLKDEYVKWACEALYIGGGDTTVSALTTFFLVMALYPDVQKSAQADIDQLVSNRLPTFDDFDSLPYLRAIIKEVVRWGTVAPLGVQHAVLKDDVYENYLIPKGTRVVANIWAMAHDEEVYPDPFHFDPSRHLGDNPQLDPFKFIFGFGKRICPGIHLGELSLFLSMTRILAVFDISKSVDEHGNEIEQKIEWTSSVIPYLFYFTLKNLRSFVVTSSISIAGSNLAQKNIWLCWSGNWIRNGIFNAFCMGMVYIGSWGGRCDILRVLDGMTKYLWTPAY